MSFFRQSPLNDNYIELIIMTLYPKLILDALSTVPYPDSDPHCGVEEVIRIKNGNDISVNTIVIQSEAKNLGNIYVKTLLYAAEIFRCAQQLVFLPSVV